MASKASGGTRITNVQSQIPEPARKVIDIIESEGTYDYTKYGSLANKSHQFKTNDSPVTKEQEEAIQWYQKDGYMQIQMHQSQGISLSKNIQEKIDAIDSAFKPLPKDVIVYRGANSSRKGISKSYTSTTLWVELTATYSYKDNFKIYAYKLPKGTPVIRRSQEQEIILPRNFNLNKYKIR